LQITSTDAFSFALPRDKAQKQIADRAENFAETVSREAEDVQVKTKRRIQARPSAIAQNGSRPGGSLAI